MRVLTERESYTVLIDESGDQGVNNFITAERPRGAAPFMVMSAAIVRDSNLEKVRDLLTKTAEHLDKKNLHCQELSHWQKCYLGRALSKFPCYYFSVVSAKETISGYNQVLEQNRERRNLKSKAQPYYNKCSHYLLELVGGFASERQIAPSEISVIFEEIRGHDYDVMKRYLRKIQLNPEHENAKRLSGIDIARISAAPKSDEPLLQIPDYVAHSVFSAITPGPTNFGLPEQRYLREISMKFPTAGDPPCRENYSINVIKWPSSFSFEASTERYFQKFVRSKKANSEGT